MSEIAQAGTNETAKEKRRRGRAEGESRASVGQRVREADANLVPHPNLQVASPWKERNDPKDRHILPTRAKGGGRAVSASWVASTRQETPLVGAPAHGPRPAVHEKGWEGEREDDAGPQTECAADGKNQASPCLHHGDVAG